MNEKKIPATPPFKNLAIALLFTVFLGPIGLLYSSAIGGIILTLFAFIVAIDKLLFLFILTWLCSSFWSVLATNRYNKKILERI